MRLMSWKREFGLAARTRSHAGFGSGAARGRVRVVFACPFCFIPASRMVECSYDESGEPLAELCRRSVNAQVARLRNAQARIAAGVDGGERGEVHVDVEREPMVRPAPGHPYAERRDLGTVHIDSGRARPARGVRADEVDHGLLEKMHELLDLDAAPPEIDQRIEHDLPRAVIRSEEHTSELQ